MIAAEATAAVDETNREIASPRAAHGRLGKDGQRRRLPAASPDPSLPDAGFPAAGALRAAAVCVLGVWPEAEVEEGQGAPRAERPPPRARKPWARWTPEERAELTLASNHQFWLVTEAWMADIRKGPAAGLAQERGRIGLKPFHVAVLAGHMEVVRAFIEHRPAARRDGSYREFLVETTKNASTPFTAIELAALAGRPDVYRFLAGLQNGLGGHVRGKKRPL